MRTSKTTRSTKNENEIRTLGVAVAGRKESGPGDKVLRLLCDTMPLPVIISREADGCILHLNRIAADWLGLSGKQARGHYSKEFFRYPKRRSVVLQALHEHGFLRGENLKFLHPGGPSSDISFSSQQIDYEDAPALFTGWTRANPQPTAGTEAAGDSFHDLMAGSLQGVVIARNFEILAANQALADMLGYDGPEELVRMERFEALIAAPDVPRLRAYSAAREQGRPAPTDYEFWMARKDGSKRLMRNRVTPIRWRGTSARQSCLQDITEWRRAEEGLAQCLALMGAATQTLASTG